MLQQPPITTRIDTLFPYTTLFRSTVFKFFSVTKAVASTAVHVQAEKGLLDYDRPIADYWPEFGRNGKDDVTVRDALNHHTGTPQMPLGTTPETICRLTTNGLDRKSTRLNSRH